MRDLANLKMRKRLSKMSSIDISKLYKDHLKYEFPAGELYKLLGE